MGEAERERERDGARVGEVVSGCEGGFGVAARSGSYIGENWRGSGTPALPRWKRGREEDKAGCEIAEHFAASARVVDVPKGEQGAEKGVGPVFDRLRPWGGKERVGFRIEEKKGKLASEECREQALQSAKLKPTGGDGAFLVFDDAWQPEEPDHRGVRVNFSGETGRGSFDF